MTLEQEIKLAAKHAAEKAAKEAAEKAYEKGYKKAYKEACEKFDKKAEKEKEMAVKNNARKLKESGVSVEIISKCTGLSLEEVEAL